MFFGKDYQFKEDEFKKKNGTKSQTGNMDLQRN